jgi:hypothetical protein
MESIKNVVRDTLILSESVKVSKYQSIKVSKYQSIKVSKYQSIKVSSYHFYNFFLHTRFFIPVRLCQHADTIIKTSGLMNKTQESQALKEIN